MSNMIWPFSLFDTKLDNIVSAINLMARTQTAQGKIIMATQQQVTDLTAAVAALTTSVATETANIATNDTAVQAEIAALAAAVSGAGLSDPAIDQAIANITQLTQSTATAAASIATETANLTASLQTPAPGTTPPPAPQGRRAPAGG